MAIFKHIAPFLCVLYPSTPCSGRPYPSVRNHHQPHDIEYRSRHANGELRRRWEYCVGALHAAGQLENIRDLVSGGTAGKQGDRRTLEDGWGWRRRRTGRYFIGVRPEPVGHCRRRAEPDTGRFPAVTCMRLQVGIWLRQTGAQASLFTARRHRPTDGLGSGRGGGYIAIVSACLSSNATNSCSGTALLK
jgi:hypothetical protein